jgi:ribonuclease HII
LFEIENRLYSEGHKVVACIDEVGRGCLFGDVVACALALPPNYTILGVKDSKKLSTKKREMLYDYILRDALAVGIGRVDCSVIDRINIKQATRLAMKNALQSMTDKEGNLISPSYLLIDAETIDSEIPQMGIIDGDNLVHGISAASIVAKVFRDRLCIDWDKSYPQYEIFQNKGYGTSKHIEALRLYGQTPLHRKSFNIKTLEGKK